MEFKGVAKILRIYIGEHARSDGGSLYEAIVKKAQENDLAGATVVRGIEGFGAGKRVHKFKAFRISEVPITIEFVDIEEKILKFVPIVDKMVTQGLIVLEDINVVAYRHPDLT